jgi:hypothetical protein
MPSAEGVEKSVRALPHQERNLEARCKPPQQFDQVRSTGDVSCRTTWTKDLPAPRGAINTAVISGFPGMMAHPLNRTHSGPGPAFWCGGSTALCTTTERHFEEADQIISESRAVDLALDLGSDTW